MSVALVLSINNKQTKTHRETDRFFFEASGIQLAQVNRGLFHFCRVSFDQQIKNRVDLPEMVSVYPTYMLNRVTRTRMPTDCSSTVTETMEKKLVRTTD